MTILENLGVKRSLTKQISRVLLQNPVSNPGLGPPGSVGVLDGFVRELVRVCLPVCLIC